MSLIMTSMVPIPGKPFLIAGAIALSGVMAGIVALPRDSAPAASRAAGVVKAQFEQRWEDSEPPPLKKTDRLPLQQADWRPVQDPGPIPKHPESEVPPPAKMPAVVALPNEDDDDRPVSRRHHRARDVCARHGMHRVAIGGGRSGGGRSWRCRR